MKVVLELSDIDGADAEQSAKIMDDILRKDLNGIDALTYTVTDDRGATHNITVSRDR